MSTTSKKTGTQSSSTLNSSKTSETAAAATEKLQQAKEHFISEPARDVFAALKAYAHDKPDVAAMWCFGLGLMVGWKLRG